jgi:replicative DNA helicase Mcm
MLQLCGGASHKKLPDGTKIRDSIHILMIGDPGTAKSQILKYVNRLAPKSLYVSGKSATGGGLTAIAEKDEFGEGGWVLKAGALVLASGGLACIDEFDKMSEEDRSAIHEALEQQTVSVAKAGIIATFRSDSAVLAAANPKYSRYDPYKPPAEQFNIPASLISRFDLIFPIKDVMDETKDKELASHILKAHKFSQATAAKREKEVKELEEKLLPSIDQDLLKKYFAYARRNCHPILTDEAINRIQNYYVDLRKRSSGGSVPLTPRQLEGLVRLAEASAKVRLSKNVDMEDAERAIRLVEFVLREIGMEKEGGGFDIDRIMAEHPKSERDKIYTITGIVKGLEEEYDMVPMERVLEEAQEYHNIDNRTAEKLVHELVNKGDLYEPRHGHLKTVKQ